MEKVEAIAACRRPAESYRRQHRRACTQHQGNGRDERRSHRRDLAGGRPRRVPGRKPQGDRVNVFKLGAVPASRLSPHMPKCRRSSSRRRGLAGEIFDGPGRRRQDQASRICSTTATSRSPNTRPQKFKTRFDDFTDQAVVPLQEQLLASTTGWSTRSASTATATCRRTTASLLASAER
jgi:hypothetical protein